jgi:hypothetical protein
MILFEDLPILIVVLLRKEMFEMGKAINMDYTKKQIKLDPEVSRVN